MPKCQLGMQRNVQGHRIASVCKQTYDASCTVGAQGEQLKVAHESRVDSAWQAGKPRSTWLAIIDNV